MQNILCSNLFSDWRVPLPGLNYHENNPEAQLDHMICSTLAAARGVLFLDATIAEFKWNWFFALSRFEHAYTEPFSIVGFTNERHCSRAYSHLMVKDKAGYLQQNIQAHTDLPVSVKEAFPLVFLLTIGEVTKVLYCQKQTLFTLGELPEDINDLNPNT